jgi:steroid 5-alpha reductase family enzyme
MESLPNVLGLNLAMAVALMVLLWILSLRLRDVSIIDIAWGGAGAIIAILTFLNTDGTLSRRVLLTSLTVIWGVRLALHIGIRKWGKPEDFRYAAFRAEHGETWPLRSLFTVFLLQAFLIWIVTMPVQVGQFWPTPAGLTPLEWVGAAIWAEGFLWQAVADFQLTRFLADPANAGTVLDRGLWRYSRHPNYFGETLMWWGIFLIAVVTPKGWLTALSPVLITYLLTKKSGVPLLEESLMDRREGYREYVRRTNAFFPWPPRSPSR